MDPVLPLNFSIRETDFPDDHRFLWEGIRILSQAFAPSKTSSEPTEILEITEKVILPSGPSIPWQMRGEQLHRECLLRLQVDPSESPTREITGKILNQSLETILKLPSDLYGPSQSLSYFLDQA